MARYNFLKEISQNGKWENRQMEKHRHLHMRGGLRRIPVVYAELKRVSVAEIDLREHETENQQGQHHRMADFRRTERSYMKRFTTNDVFSWKKY